MSPPWPNLAGIILWNSTCISKCNLTSFSIRFGKMLFFFSVHLMYSMLNIYIVWLCLTYRVPISFACTKFIAPCIRFINIHKIYCSMVSYIIQNPNIESNSTTYSRQKLKTKISCQWIFQISNKNCVSAWINIFIDKFEVTAEMTTANTVMSRIATVFG